MDILTHPKEISPIQGKKQIRLEPNSRKPEKKKKAQMSNLTVFK